MLKDAEILIFDLLTLDVFFVEVDKFSILFRALDRLEELAANIQQLRQ